MGVVEDQVLDVKEFARDPHAGGRIKEMPALREPLPDRAPARDFIEPG